eukprot:CAMPEP_0184490262 /NCGR_PEP_ID=MMETSP0113_2-20130426/17422_1 /TAXON_ID=91329 /ORGANISM="Norrisiella sphaerica, Strain BC52" /LENGTH=620 /DNA_ID=CAMNT_0026874053 /DNA_START=87 /DNA_END=1949 /DNA_ORIENTATION=+
MFGDSSEMHGDADRSFQSDATNQTRARMDSSLESVVPRPGLDNLDLQALKNDLMIATRELFDRGLTYAAKWTGEFVVDMDSNEDDDERNSSVMRGRSKIKPTQRQLKASNLPGGDAILSESESNAVAIARIYFDLRQYKRAAQALENYSSSKALFLRFYSTYMAGEKDRISEMQQKTEPLARAKVQNRELIKLEDHLGKVCVENKNSESKQKGADPFCMYLYALVLKHLDRPNKAIQALVKSVNMYPFNWSAWKLLASLMKSKEMVAELEANLREHCIKQMFLADVYLELQHHETNECMDILEQLSDYFPNSAHIAAQLAMAHYNLREFDDAQRLFQVLHENDPCRLETMDVYSNILFVKECKAELSFLANTAIKIDKYRPETCCIIGNYYSLKGEHERAVIYFKRALRLDPNYLSAWTLMGHEYVEMRNSAAAIESYRRAVDINPRDYRAWYGLGQAHEIMRMHNYALYYFRKAAKLRPYDPRMWCALGETFERMGRYEDAIKCYRQAEGNDDPEGTAILKLASAYQKAQEMDMAAEYYRKVLKQRAQEGSQEERQDNADALLFLAKYTKDRESLRECEVYCNRLLDIGGSVKDEAKAILQEVRLMKGKSPDAGDSKKS